MIQYHFIFPRNLDLNERERGGGRDRERKRCNILFRKKIYKFSTILEFKISLYITCTLLMKRNTYFEKTLIINNLIFIRMMI